MTDIKSKIDQTIVGKVSFQQTAGFKPIPGLGVISFPDPITVECEYIIYDHSSKSNAGEFVCMVKIHLLLMNAINNTITAYDNKIYASKISDMSVSKIDTK